MLAHSNQIEDFGSLISKGTMSILDYGKAEIQHLEVDVDGLITRSSHELEEPYHNTVQVTDTDDVQALKNGVMMHNILSQSLYEQHLRTMVPLPTGFPKEELDSSSGGDE